MVDLCLCLSFAAKKGSITLRLVLEGILRNIREHVLNTSGPPLGLVEQRKTFPKTVGIKGLPTCFTPSTTVVTDLHDNFMLNPTSSLTEVKTYQSHVLTKSGPILDKLMDSFFNEISLKWKFCCFSILNIDVRLSFNEIRVFFLEEFKCVGLLDVFQHNLGFTIFKFDTYNNLIKVTTTGSLFVENVSQVFEIFFKSWN